MRIPPVRAHESVNPRVLRLPQLPHAPETPNPFDRSDAPGDDRPTPPPVVPLDDIRAILATCALHRRAAAGESTWFEWFRDARDAAIVRGLAGPRPR